MTTDRRGTFEEYKRILETLYHMAGEGPAIDLGCGQAHVTQHWPGAILVDLVNRPNPHIPIILMDIREVPKSQLVRRERIRLMVMTDSLEHLTKDDGQALLTEMWLYCDAQVIFTPMGAHHLKPDSTHLDDHKSAWYAASFAQRNWSVWSWPSYHHFEDGSKLGAFWAWRFHRDTPTPEAVAIAAQVEL